MQRSGIGLKLADDSYQHIFMKLGCFLADEAALHFGYGNKGAGGLKPCILCANIFNAKIRPETVARDPTGIAQHHTIDDASKLMLHTPESITAIMRKLEGARPNLSNRHFAELETECGWNYTPRGVMWDPIVRPIIEPSATATFDWMHIIFVHGVFGVHMGLVMWKLNGVGVTYQKMHDFIQKFRWPRQHAKNCGKEVCAPKRAQSCWKATTFKCTASEGLSLVPILARFFTEFLQTPALPANVRGIAANVLQLVGVVHLILRSARCKVTPVSLCGAIKDYLSGFRQLHGEEPMIIKFHLLLHLPAHLERYGFLPNCFVHERKHNESKRYANQKMNTDGDWEIGILRDVTCHHLRDLQEGSHFCDDAALTQPYTPHAKVVAALVDQFGVATYTVSRTARSRGGDQITIGDVVIYQDGADTLIGEIGMLVSADVHGDPILVVLMEAFDHVQTTYGNDIWKPRGLMRVCHLANINAPCCWCPHGDDILTLRPVWVI